MDAIRNIMQAFVANENAITKNVREQIQQLEVALVKLQDDSNAKVAEEIANARKALGAISPSAPGAAAKIKGIIAKLFGKGIPVSAQEQISQLMKGPSDSKKAGDTLLAQSFDVSSLFDEGQDDKNDHQVNTIG